MNLKNELKKSKTKICIFYIFLFILCIYFVTKIVSLFFSPHNLIKNGWIIIIAGLLIIYLLVYFFIAFKNYFKSPYAIMNFKDLDVLQNELNESNMLTEDVFIGKHHLFVKNIFYCRIIPINEIDYICQCLEVKNAGGVYIKPKEEKAYISLQGMTLKSSNHVFTTIATYAPTVLMKRFFSYKEMKKFFKDFDRHSNHKNDSSLSTNQNVQQETDFFAQEDINKLSFWYTDLKRSVLGTLLCITPIMILLIVMSKELPLLELPRAFYMIGFLLFFVLYFTILFRFFERRGALSVEKKGVVIIQFAKKKYKMNIQEIERVQYLGNRLVINMKNGRKFVLWEPIYHRNDSGIYEIYKKLNRQ